MLQNRKKMEDNWIEMTDKELMEIPCIKKFVDDCKSLIEEWDFDDPDGMLDALGHYRKDIDDVIDSEYVNSYYMDPDEEYKKRINDLMETLREQIK